MALIYIITFPVSSLATILSSSQVLWRLVTTSEISLSVKDNTARRANDGLQLSLPPGRWWWLMENAFLWPNFREPVLQALLGHGAHISRPISVRYHHCHKHYDKNHASLSHSHIAKPDLSATTTISPMSNSNNECYKSLTRWAKSYCNLFPLPHRQTAIHR
jgi:hypothetical protein